MVKKHQDISALPSKMQRVHGLLGNLDVLGLHELPLFAAACHLRKEEAEMLEVFPEMPPSQDETLRADVPPAVAETPLPPPFKARQPPPTAAKTPLSPASDTIFRSHFSESGEATTAASGSAAADASSPAGKQQRKRKAPVRDHAVRHEAAPLSGPVTAVRLQAAISSWDDVPEARRRALLTAIRHAEHLLSVSRDRLQGAAPWSCAGLNRVLWAQAPSCYGLSKDTHRNMLSGLRYMLCRLGLHADGGYGRNRLSPAWQALYEQLPTVERQRGLVLFLRFLTLSGVAPETATPDIIDRFEAWCGSEILEKDPGGMGRRAAGNWSYAQQHVPGWPQVAISRTGMRDHYGIPLEQLPASFQAEVEKFLAGLAVDPLAQAGGDNAFRRLAAQARERANAAMPLKAPTSPKPQSSRSSRRALSPRTLQTRRDQIKLAATALVHTGVPIERITALAVLVTPLDHAGAILDFHRERLRQRLLQAGEDPAEDDLRNSTLAGIGEVLRQIGKFVARLPAAEMEELNGLLGLVKPDQQLTMSDKNRVRLKALLADPAYSMLLHAPEKWMLTDAVEPGLKPRDAALLAMYAAALEVFLFLPLRRGNLLQLRLDVHLRRSAGGGFITEIYIPAKMVKNRVPIHWPVERDSARLLDLYIRKYRPQLAAAGNEFLFPGIGDSHRDDAEFGSTLSARVEQEIGALFNCHLARHFSVVRYLRQHPGAYEIAAQILGHKNPETTRRFYCGLEQDAAARHVNALLTQERQQTKLLALGAYHRPRRRPKGGRS